MSHPFTISTHPHPGPTKKQKTADETKKDDGKGKKDDGKGKKDDGKGKKKRCRNQFLNFRMIAFFEPMHSSSPQVFSNTYPIKPINHTSTSISISKPTQNPCTPCNPAGEAHRLSRRPPDRLAIASPLVTIRLRLWFWWWWCQWWFRKKIASVISISTTQPIVQPIHITQPSQHT